MPTTVLVMDGHPLLPWKPSWVSWHPPIFKALLYVDQSVSLGGNISVCHSLMWHSCLNTCFQQAFFCLLPFLIRAICFWTWMCWLPNRKGTGGLNWGAKDLLYECTEVLLAFQFFCSSDNLYKVCLVKIVYLQGTFVFYWFLLGTTEFKCYRIFSKGRKEVCLLRDSFIRQMVS